MGQSSFGPFVLDVDRGSLKRDGKPVALGQHGLALLAALLDAEGAPVTREDLMARAWPGLVVEDGNLTVQIATLRRALGPAPDGGAWIATVPRLGYRLQRSVATGTERAIGRRPALAVLPFTNMSGDAGDEYFADGIVEDIITALARVKSIRVIARNSSFVYKGRAVDVRQVAADLGVGYVLEGSTRRMGDRLRVTGQLVETTNGAHLWARNFDCDVKDVFDVQDEIVALAVSAIDPQIRQEEIERAKRKHPASLDAYDLSLRAIPKYHAGRPEDNAEACELLSRSLAIDPTYAPTLARAAQAFGQRSGMGWSSSSEDDVAYCVDLCWRAIEQAPDDGVILAMCGLTLLQTGRLYDAGLEVLNNALKANPNSLVVRINCGIGELHCGSIERSLEHSRLAIGMTTSGDPNAQYPITAIAHAQMALGNYEEALRFAEQSIVINPHFSATLWMLIAANVHLGQMEEAHRWLAALRERSPTSTVSRIRAGQPAKIAGRIEPILEGLRLAGLPES